MISQDLSLRLTSMNTRFIIYIQTVCKLSGLFDVNILRSRMFIWN